MATATTAYRANDGSLHDTECGAATRDLQLLIADSACAENAPYSRTMLGWLTSQPREIAASLIAYADACPQEDRTESDAPADATVSNFSEADPCAHEPYCQSRHNDALPCDCGASEREGCKDRGQGMQGSRPGDAAVKNVAVAIDKWKLAIFKRHLDAASCTYDELPGVTADTMILKVKCHSIAPLKKVIEAAVAECAAQ